MPMSARPCLEKPGVRGLGRVEFNYICVSVRHIVCRVAALLASGRLPLPSIDSLPRKRGYESPLKYHGKILRMRKGCVSITSDIGGDGESRQRNDSHNISASSPLAWARRSFFNGGMASTHGVPNRESKRTMSMRAIETWFTGKPVDLDNARERRVLTGLKMIYEGGSLDGTTANLTTRDVSSVVVGLHRGDRHFFETYKRTIWVNVRNRRTIFRWAGLTVKSDNSSWLKRLLAVLRIRKLKAIVV